MIQATVFYIAIIILLFGGPGVLYYTVGWAIDTGDAPAYQKLRPELYLLIFLVLINLKSIIILRLKCRYLIKNEIIIVLLSLFTFVLWLLLGQVDGFAVLPNTIVEPVLISMLLYVVPGVKRLVVRRILLLFFLSTILVAIIERVTLHQIIPYYSGGELRMVFDYVEEGFRSNAFRNHPLSNASLIAAILPYILFNNYIKRKYINFILFTLGYISFFCFNTRSSIMIWGVFFLIFWVADYFRQKVFRINTVSFVFSILFFILLFICLVSLGYGDRLFVENNLNDESVFARVDIVKLVVNTDWSIFFYGMTTADTFKLAALADIYHIENFWILYLFRFGLILFVLFTIYMAKVIKKRVCVNDNMIRFYVLVVPMLIASCNDSIFSGDPVLAVLILCQYAFLSFNNKNLKPNFTYA